MGKCEIIEASKKLFLHTQITRKFYHEARIKITRKEARNRLEELNLACELVKLIRHVFPDLILLLKQVKAPRRSGYITYLGEHLLLTRILSSIFYISSMRKKRRI